MHIVVWLLFFAIMILPGLFGKPTAVVVYFCILFLILLLATYINIGFLITRYFDKEKYRNYILSLLVLWLAALVCVYVSTATLMFPLYTDNYIKHVAGAMVAFSMEFFLFALYKVARQWYIKSQRSKEMELAKVQAELSLLRSQLDAHFIFNTLNNLYLLVLNKSDKAPGAIIMLSDLLSYTIYESRREYIEITKELEFIENYINLQMLRLDKSQVVCFDVQGGKQGHIVPLVLFNFIENTFKHADGLVTINGQQYFVYISIEIQAGELVLLTVNGKQSMECDKNDDHNGVGLVNARKRLDLQYADRYTIDILESASEYRLTLTINIS